MIEPLPDLPAGVIGFKVAGKIEASDYKDILIPAVERAVADGAVRVVIDIESFDGLSGSALVQDLKLGFEHFRDWKKTALVTDIEWMVHATQLFAWLTPGEVKCFPLSQRDEAIAWAARPTGANSPVGGVARCHAGAMADDFDVIAFRVHLPERG